MIMSDKYHVIRITSPERRQKITVQRKQSDQDIVDNVDDIRLALANINPAWIGNILSAFHIAYTSAQGQLLLEGIPSNDFRLPIRNKTQARPKSVMRTAYSVTKNPRAKNS